MSIRPQDVGKRAEIRWADGSLRAVGNVIAHSLVPSVLIETDDGERVWWRHDMGDVSEHQHDCSLHTCWRDS